MFILYLIILYLLIYYDLPLFYFYTILDYTVVPSFASVSYQYLNIAIDTLNQMLSACRTANGQFTRNIIRDFYL